MRFRYIGKCEAGFVTLMGIRFDEGSVVEVEDEYVIKKLLANSHFQEVKTRQRRENSDDNSGSDQA